MEDDQDHNTAMINVQNKEEAKDDADQEQLEGEDGAEEMDALDEEQAKKK